MPILLKYVLPPILAILLVVGVFFAGFHLGGNACEKKQAVGQLKQNKKLQKDYDKIKRNIPDNLDDSIEWLLDNASQR